MQTDPKVIIITGASRGIGNAIANTFIQKGHRVVVALRSRKSFEETFQTDLANLHFIEYEAKQKGAAKTLIDETLNHYGRLDVLINCAGILLSSSLEDDIEDDTAIDEMYEINFKAPLKLIKAALPYLKQSGSGRVINVVSLSGKRVKGKSIGYSASKHALMALTHTTRFVGWEYGIRATAVCPSWVNTDMVKDLNVVPTEDMIQPEDLAKLVYTVVELPNNASVAELNVNCVLESFV